ncbi:hypothetical protein CLPU_5c01070 [Gottschalkia purinilytica]|uniref:DUF3787 domain-containing protein n=1 Tax=Gottschalkia purinilytica TaxID=1503 RepID=A0A0L0WBS0_GOTPU|nr:DUF3787 domain-containing protein [Gottschalkia purinilytica]KNF08800.1 hypothetical protein CLPU_5c01070 [Gottschalkia purinilytica]
MKDNTIIDKQNNRKEPHKNAAWADIHKVQPESNVPIPSLTNVIEAKEWVEHNKK